MRCVFAWPPQDYVDPDDVAEAQGGVDVLSLLDNLDQDEAVRWECKMVGLCGEIACVCVEGEGGINIDTHTRRRIECVCLVASLVSVRGFSFFLSFFLRFCSLTCGIFVLFVCRMCSMNKA